MTGDDDSHNPPGAAGRSGARSKPAGGLLASGMVVASGTGMSRVLGLLRDIVLANILGASSAADAFLVAFKIPNFFRRLFAEGAFAQAFVPVLTDYKERHPQDVATLIGAVTGVAGSILMLVTIAGVLAAPLLVGVFAPGFWDDAYRFNLTIELLRWTFPYLGLISLTAFASAILNTYGRFAVPAYTPVLLNLTLIGSALVARALMLPAAPALAVGVLVAGVVQLAFQLPFIASLGMWPRPRLDFHHPGLRRIGALMLPALFGVSVGQLNLLLDTLLASFLVSGSISWLYFSDRLMELPLGLFAIALATVLLPSLSKLASHRRFDAFGAGLDWGIRLVLLLGLPATLALTLLAQPLLFTLFQYGEMTPHDVAMAAPALRAYAFGLLGFMLVKVLAPGYFARQDTRTPVRIGIYAMVTNMVLNLTLIWWLAHVGLALATSLAAFLNAGLLLRGLWRTGMYQPGPGWSAFLVRVLSANLVMAGLLYALVPAAGVWQAAGAPLRAGMLGAATAGGLLVYLLILAATGMRPRHIRAPALMQEAVRSSGD